ncbi:Regulatory protein RepA [Rubripirellula lacrimiformis]|uniref:Regulatory protein RepA n=1 Tax=Rubripirellula lacrimiformis TaxID=1930273 RepID=A0A517NDX4_9BACT|nr:AAA family ATPase [Rubripirellula lacrimiformis]QDT05334.1 Regulatory protein RepA [Rubripirellula lacrimiformis]
MDETPPTRIYNDGPCFPRTTMGVEAEKAYRDWFAETAMSVPAWKKPNRTLFRELMLARERLRAKAVVGADHGVCVFRPDHPIEASKARGRAQAVWIAIEGWRHFSREGFDTQTIRTVAMTGWNARVQRWCKGLLRPDQIIVPPRPHEDLDASTQDRLDEIRQSWELTHDTLPRAADIRPRSLRRLLDRYPLLKPPIIHGLLRAGETMNVIASPKVGKSWLASDMALAVATGRPWLGRFDTEPGDVLIIDNELHPTTSANRIPKVMDARGITPDDVADHLFVSNLRGNLKDIRSLGAYFDHVFEDRFKMIVIDAFYRMLPAESDENDNAAMASVYNTIDRYAEMLGSAFVLIHHTSKGNQSFKSITDVGAGAGSQARATDSHLVLRPHEQDGAIVLDAAVRSWPPVDPVCLRWNFPVWDVEMELDPTNLRNESRRRKTKPDKPADVPEWTAQRFVEAFVGVEPKPTVVITTEAKEAGLSERRASSLLKQAEATGLAHRWRFAPNQRHQFATQPQPENPTEPTG